MDQDPNKLVKIPGELTSVAVEQIVSATSAIYDYDEQKFQSEINKQKADKVPDASGNFAKFDASGNLMDSGINPDNMVTDYNGLENRPQINGHTLEGNQTGTNIGLVDSSVINIGESGNFVMFENGKLVDSGINDKNIVTSYDRLTDIPKVNGHDFIGTLTGAALDLVDASEGWGLSQEDYTTDMKNWVEGKMQQELEQEALSKYSVTTTSSPSSFMKDTVQTQSFIATVTVKFDGSNVKTDNLPSEWNKTDQTGIYTRTIETSSTSNIPAEAWEYTPSSGKYAGINLQKNSTPQSITAVYPSYYGILTSNDTTNIQQKAASLNSQHRAESNVSNTSTYINSTGSTAWFCILTHGTATATQLNISILGEPVSVDSFISPVNNTIAMSGYKMYISKNSIAVGGTLKDVKLNITL